MLANLRLLFGEWIAAAVPPGVPDAREGNEASGRQYGCSELLVFAANFTSLDHRLL